MNDNSKPTAGETVVLKAVPPGLLDGLPQEDQDAITAIVGKPVILVEYDEDGRAELLFKDPIDDHSDFDAHIHTIWVPASFIRRFRS